MPKMICGYCGLLTPEDEIIKMTTADFKSYEQVRRNIPTIQIAPDDHQRWSYICEPCYTVGREEAQIALGRCGCGRPLSPGTCSVCDRDE